MGKKERKKKQEPSAPQFESLFGFISKSSQRSLDHKPLEQKLTDNDLQGCSKIQLNNQYKKDEERRKQNQPSFIYPSWKYHPQVEWLSYQNEQEFKEIQPPDSTTTPTTSSSQGQMNNPAIPTVKKIQNGRQFEEQNKNKRKKMNKSEHTNFICHLMISFRQKLKDQLKSQLYEPHLRKRIFSQKINSEEKLFYNFLYLKKNRAIWRNYHKVLKSQLQLKKNSKDEIIRNKCERIEKELDNINDNRFKIAFQERFGPSKYYRKWKLYETREKKSNFELKKTKQIKK